jgi:hypothetical protein
MAMAVNNLSPVGVFTESYGAFKLLADGRLLGGNGSASVSQN